MSNSELQTKRNAHREAQDARRALEQEQRELPAQLDFAVSGADVARIHALNKRKRELPGEIQAASAVEHATYGALVRAEQQSELALYEVAQSQLDQAEAELVKKRAEWAQEDRKLADEVDRWTVKRNQHEREHEAWSARFSTADRRYRQVIGKQQEAA